MTYAEYSRIDAVNWSSLKSIAVSPLQYWHDLRNPRDEAPHFRIGRAIHAHILEPHTFKDHFWRHEGERRGKAWKAVKARADAAGVCVLTAPEWAAAFGAAAAVLANPHAAALLSRGLKEAVLTWTDAETGLPCKARVDHAGRSLIDLKSAARINRNVFAAAAVRLGYPGQFAFYEDGLRANGIEPQDDPHMIVVQREMPHDVIVYRMPPEVVAFGREEYRRLLAKLKHCRKTNTWPGAAPDGPMDFVLPGWALPEDEGLLFDGETMESAADSEGDAP